MVRGDTKPGPMFFTLIYSSSPETHSIPFMSHKLMLSKPDKVESPQRSEDLKR